MTQVIYEPSKVQQEAHLCDARELLYGGTAGCGKRLSVDTPIPTPSGWTTMGELQAGDVIFDEAGQPTTVTAATPILLAERSFVVKFSDGSTIEADGEHLWKTLSYYEREKRAHRTEEFRSKRREKRAKRGAGKRPDAALLNSLREHEYLEPHHGSVRTTDEIRASLYEHGKINHSVASCEPLNTPTASLPLDPYVLGAWLGDGTGTNGSITGIDEGIFDEIRKAGFEPRKPPSSKNTWTVLGLKPVLRELDLLSERKSARKRIPSSYLRSDIGQRLALLQGLMDTDGYCSSSSGRCEFTTTNYQLRRDVYELLCSLGIKASVGEGVASLRGRVIGAKWRISFYSKLPVFRLQRKLCRQKVSGFRGACALDRYIVAVDPIAPKLMRCIAVDSPSHMYLAGRSMIPTHNTVFLRMDPFVVQMYGEIERWKAARAAGQTFRSVGHALYLRREFPMLVQFMTNLLDTAFKIDPDFHWSSEYKILTHPCGFKYQLGHLQKPDDWRLYDSNEYTWIGFDEAIQFSEQQYTMLSSRLRTTDPVLMRKLRIRLASNPDAPAEGLWVKKRFVDPAPCGRKLLTERIKLSDGTVEERERLYIPARLSDNPNGQYRRDYETSLRQLPHHVMLARLEGRWDVVSDAFFAYEWQPDVHVVKPFPIPAGWPRCRSMDWGYKVACPVLWGAITPDNDIVVYREVTFNHEVKEKDRKDGELVALAIRRVEMQHGEWDKQSDSSRLTGPADYQIAAKTGTVGPSIEESMAAHGVYWEKATKDKVAATAEFIRRLRDIPKKPGTRPGITFFDTCTNCIRTIPLIRIDPNDPEKPLDDNNNHWLNAIQYMVMSRMASPTEREVADAERHPQWYDDDFDELKKRRELNKAGTAVGGGYFG